MKVSKAQAQANRDRIVETASVLFRERGYDGIGVADLMSAAGFTHGGFYRHFESKADLMAQAAAFGLAQTLGRMQRAKGSDFIQQYLSRAHRDAPGDGCTLAALGADAARQPEQVKAAFAQGLEETLASLVREDQVKGAAALREARAHVLGTFAQLVGAIVLSRACPHESPLADEILKSCRAAMGSKQGAKAGARSSAKRDREGKAAVPRTS